MTSFNFHNLEECHPSDLGEVKRLLFGRSDDHEIDLDAETKNLSEEYNFEVRGYALTAEPEEFRKPRIVRVAAVQNSIVERTTEKVAIQRDALFSKISNIIKAAAASKENIICLQEAWTMPFAFCTREKRRWCSSYISAPDGTRTPGLSRDQDGLLIAELDFVPAIERLLDFSYDSTFG